MSESVDTEIVKNWLKTYRDKQIEYEMQKERLERLVCMAENVGSPKLTDMPKAPSPSTDKMSDYVQRKDELIAQVGDIFDYSKKTREQIESVLRYVKKVEERMIIRYRYIDVMEWKEIVDLIYAGKDDLLIKWDSYLKSVFSTHAKAVAEMVDIMGVRAGEDGIPRILEIA